MAEVVDLASIREAKKIDGYMVGEARCLSCGHKWVSVAPIGVLWLECPECHCMKGRYVHPNERDVPHWKCNCGNDLFYVTPDGYYCPNCGEWAEGF